MDLAIQETDHRVDFPSGFEGRCELLDRGVVGFCDLDAWEGLLSLLWVPGKNCYFEACFKEVRDDCWAESAIWLRI